MNLCICDQQSCEVPGIHTACCLFAGIYMVTWYPTCILTTIPPLHFIPITRILGWKGCPPRYLSSLSRHPFLWLEWGNLGHWEKTSMLKIPSFPMYWHILNNRTLRCLASKAGKGKELLVPRMTAETWYTYQTTTTNISLWSAKNCRRINNLVER